jgi:LPS-assembly protein
VYNLGYRFDRDRIVDPGSNGLLRDLEQLDMSVAQPVGERWTLFARYQYDIDGDFSLETMAGVQYESCCWLTRFAYQRAVLNENLNNGSLQQDYDNTFLLEFQLKGLGSIGNQVLSLLQESILGYEEQDY